MPDDRLSVQSPFSLGPKTSSTHNKSGRVSLVGAGPGDPGLITIRGVELLRQADIVLYDALANEQLLRHAPQAEWVSVGKHGTGKMWTQDEINARLVDLAQAGKHVVRLKGGDPAVFARTADELEVLVNCGIPFEVVPGITAALAAASYVGIPLTHRHHASAVAFITGQQQDGTPQPIDWISLAKFPGTLVFYMGVTSAEHWTEQLIQAGMPDSMPAAVIRRCSWSDQLVFRCSLGEVAARLRAGLRPPIIVVVGQVAGLGEQYDWYSNRPLRGVGVLVTRPVSQADQLAESLRALGADVYCQPMTRIDPIDDFSNLDHCIDRLSKGCYSGITFSSANGVEAFFNRLTLLSLDARVFSGCTIAAVGSKTAERLLRFGLRADIVPQHFGAAGLVNELATSIAGQQWLSILADQSQPALVDGLSDKGARVDSVVSYRSRPVGEVPTHILELIDKNRIQWITITSPLIARTCATVFRAYFQSLRPISFSPEISNQLECVGWPAAIQTQQPTDEQLVSSLIEYVRSKRH